MKIVLDQDKEKVKFYKIKNYVWGSIIDYKIFECKAEDIASD